MKSTILFIPAILLCASLTVRAQFMDFAMGESYDYVTSQFGEGGEYEGLRYATETEAIYIAENIYGYDFSKDRQYPGNANATYSILSEMGGLRIGENVATGDPEYEITYFAFAFLRGGSYPNGWVITHNFLPYSDEDSFTAGRIGDSWWPEEVSARYVGHLLVKGDYIIPVPEPSTAALLLVPIGLVLIIFRRKMRTLNLHRGR